MDRARLIRGLRIAWTAVCGIVCVLLVVLWVRSYYRYEYMMGSVFNLGWLQVASLPSYTAFAPFPMSEFPADYGWQVKSRLYEPYERIAPEHNLPDRSILGIRWKDKNPALFVPYWMLVFLTAVLSALPWFHWSNRFGLRTLLIATTLIAVVLGLAVWASR